MPRATPGERRNTACLPSSMSTVLELLRVYMERDMAELGRIVSLPPHQLSAALSAWLDRKSVV